MSILEARLAGSLRLRRAPSFLLVAAGLASALLVSRPAAGHGDISHQIAALTRRIAREPANAGLHLARGELFRALEDHDAALRDYASAARLDPGMAAVDLCRGRLLLEAGRPEEARRFLERFLRRMPDHVEGRVTLARALVRLGHVRLAAESFTRAIAKAPRPRPEYFLERARALAAEGDEHLESALRGLDEGIVALGPLLVLQLPAIEIELSRNRIDAALARLDTILLQAERKERWLTRRGEILERVGRCEEAREAYASALAALESLPPSRRGARAMRELEARLRAAIPG